MLYICLLHRLVQALYEFRVGSGLLFNRTEHIAPLSREGQYAIIFMAILFRFIELLRFCWIKRGRDTPLGKLATADFVNWSCTSVSSVKLYHLADDKIGEFLK